MKETRQPTTDRVETAFLDANVIRGQQTTDVLLSLASRRVFEPRWTQNVIDEMRRNRPPGLPEADIDRRIATMNKAFPRAMTEAPPQELQDQMQADPKDKHVLAGAVYSASDVLVTDNLKDFNPPTSGPSAMRVENLNQFLIRKLEEDPGRVQEGLNAMVDRNRRQPKTMSALIDTMADGQELRGFAQRLNTVVPEGQRGTSPMLTANQRGSAKYTALEGVARPATTQTPETAPEARKSLGGQGAEKAKDTEQGK